VEFHYYNSWFFRLGFLVKENPKVTSVKKPPCQYGQVILYMSNTTGQSNWTLTF
jgi:hypothetical protein